MGWIAFLFQSLQSYYWGQSCCSQLRERSEIYQTWYVPWIKHFLQCLNSSMTTITCSHWSKKHSSFQTPDFTKCALIGSKGPVCLSHCIPSCAFHINRLPKIRPRYWISVDSCSLCPERVGSVRLLKPLFLVNGINTMFCGLIDSWVLSHYYCTIPTELWRSSETLFEYFSLIRIVLSTAYPSV
jgi:hypothetical protein